jgi:hypothetical protein
MIINHNNGSLMADQYRGIKNSALYNAMATLGIDQFKFQVIETNLDIDLLNMTEKQYIEEYNCRVPHGYNMTSGGGANSTHSQVSINTMKRIKKERINNNRHKILHDMPLYFTYEKTLQAIILQKHPLCDFKGFYVRTHGSIENCKTEALKFLQELELHGIVYERKRKLANSPAKGVYEIPIGSGTYYVTKRFRCKNYRKSFSQGTPDENKLQAIQFANSLSEQPVSK